MTEISKTLVRDIMKTDVATVSHDASVKEVLRMMHKTGLSCLVVDLGDSSRGVGIVTQKDVLGVLVDPEEDLKSLKAANVMTAPAVSVSPEFGVPTCVQMMRMIGVRRVPVIDGSKLVGIISFADIFNHAIRSVL